MTSSSESVARVVGSRISKISGPRQCFTEWGEWRSGVCTNDKISSEKKSEENLGEGKWVKG